jgi:transposase
MAARGRLKRGLLPTGDERATLERWARRPTSAQALAQRCRMVLACSEGLTNQEVAAREGVHQVTVGKWRARFVEKRLDGLHDKPRPGAPRTISDADVERVLVKTLEESPREDAALRAGAL